MEAFALKKTIRRYVNAPRVSMASAVNYSSAMVSVVKMEVAIQVQRDRNAGVIRDIQDLGARKIRAFRTVKMEERALWVQNNWNVSVHLCSPVEGVKRIFAPNRIHLLYVEEIPRAIV